MSDPIWTTSVVCVVASTLNHDFDCPWQTRAASETIGTAVAIARGQFLVAADVVANATFIQLYRPNASSKAVARVMLINHDLALALLEIVVGGESVNVVPVELGAMPSVGDDVAIANCHESVSVARGHVAAVEVVRYTHSQRHLLAVKIDTDVEPGIGPVFLGERLVGIIVQQFTDQNRCEMVPVLLIRAFLTGQRPEVPALGVSTQNLESARLRSHLEMRAGEQGLLVTHVDVGGSADGVLAKGDVITAIEGIPITNLGMIDFAGHHVRYDALVGLRYVGDKLQLQVLRGGTARHVELVLAPWRPLVPRSRYDQPPAYVVYAGLVFQTLTRDFLTTWDEWWNKGPKEFLTLYYLGARTRTQREVVVLTQILADPINVGYGHLNNEAIATLDGKVPLDMAEFVRRLSTARGTVKIETTSGGVIVLDADEVRAATPTILARYGISADRTPGLGA
jgi:hypothetical protein